MIDHYEITKSVENYTYEFESIGKRGKIRKIVKFIRVGTLEYFHFGFGDLDENTGNVDDTIVSNNGDTTLILATLGEIIANFLNEFPNAWVYAKGNTNTRNRLYRIILSQNISIIQEKYQLLGFLKGVWKPYKLNQPYTAFLIKIK